MADEVKIPSASDGAYEEATIDEAVEIRFPSVALFMRPRLMIPRRAYRSKASMLSYMDLSMSMTGLVRFCSSYISRASKSPR